MCKFAVIIPAYNEERVIRDCLDALVAQSYTDFKIHMIDDASQDSTKQIINDYIQRNPGKIFLHEFGKIGPGQSRNRVAELVGSPVVVFTDADCAPDKDWLFYLNEAFEKHPTAASIGGPQFAMPQSNSFQKKVERFFSFTSIFTDFYKNEGEASIRSTPHNPLCNVAYKRDVFLKLKGFRADFFPGEDIEFDIRLQKAGHEILFQPKAKVFHHRPENIRAFRKVMFTYGLAQGRLIREHGITRRIHWLGLFALAAILIGLPSLLGCAYGWPGLFVAAAFASAVFSIRLGTESFLGIASNSLNWLSGFASGLLLKPSKV